MELLAREAKMQDLESKIHLLEVQLAEAVESNNIYKSQLEGYVNLYCAYHYLCISTTTYLCFFSKVDSSKS